MAAARKRWAGAAALAFLLAGCNAIGPPAARTGRVAYNTAVQQSANEQLLLNLVRLRYRDPPNFLEVTSVSTSFEFRASGEAGLSIFPDSVDDEYAVGAGVAYSERPTITYLPLQGDRFVTQMLSPVGVEVIGLLANTGWRTDRVFSVLVQRAGDARNAPRAAGPTPDAAPEHEAFGRVLEILRRLYENGAIEVAVARRQDQSYLALTIAEAADDDRVAELAGLLGLAGPARRLIFSTDPQAARDIEGFELIRLETRSAVGALFYLSHATDVPEAHAEAGLVTTTTDDAGEPFDWGRVGGRYLRIRTADRRPPDAMTAVRHRGAWYYVDEADLNSKSTFVMLGQVLALQAGDIESVAPLLTLPVGGG